MSAKASRMPSFSSFSSTGLPAWSFYAERAAGGRMLSSSAGAGCPFIRPPSFFQHHHSIHFHKGAARKLGHADGGAGRIGLAEIFGHDLVHPGKMREVGEVNVELGHVVQEIGRAS